MKNILLVITKGDIGGAQMSVFSLAKKLTDLGHRVTVGHGEGDFLPPLLKKHDIPTYRFQSLRRSYNPIHNLSFFFELRKYITTHAVDVVHFNSSNTLFGAIAAQWSRPAPKTVFTFRGLSLLDPTYTSSPIKQYLYRFVFRSLLRWVDAPVFVSYENQTTAKRMNIAPDGTVIYNGLDLSQIKPLSPHDARLWCEKRISRSLSHAYVIGSIGRLAYQKNYEFLIRAMPQIRKILPHAVCLIIGDGPTRQEYESLITSLGLQESVFLLGDAPLAYQYASCFDAFVLPSRYEGMSITLIEMLAVGIPIIASDVGGNAEQLADAGLLYPLDDREAFLSAFSSLVRDAQLAESLREKAKKRATVFDITNTARGYLDLYEKDK